MLSVTSVFGSKIVLCVFMPVLQACSEGVMFSACPSHWLYWCLSHDNMARPPRLCRRVCFCANFPMQNWNSLPGGQVHYTDAGAGYQMTSF